MFLKKKSYTIKIRNFEPLTASSDVVNRKKELRDKIKKDVKKKELKNYKTVVLYCENNLFLMTFKKIIGRIKYER